MFSKPPESPASGPKQELQRAEVAARLQCSIASVQRLESLGKLTPRRDAKGRVWFSVAQVDKVRREYKPTRAQREKTNEKLVESNVRGRVAAVALPMFAAGIRDLAKICQVTAADPLLIIELFDVWRLGPEGMLAREERERERVREEQKERENQRRHDAETKQLRWIEMRLKLAEIESRGRKTG